MDACWFVCMRGLGPLSLSLSLSLYIYIYLSLSLSLFLSLSLSLYLSLFLFQSLSFTVIATLCVCACAIQIFAASICTGPVAGWRGDADCGGSSAASRAQWLQDLLPISCLGCPHDGTDQLKVDNSFGDTHQKGVLLFWRIVMQVCGN